MMSFFLQKSPRLILPKIVKGLALIVASGLSACTLPPLRDHELRPVEMTQVKPINTPALVGRDLVSYDVYADGGKLHALFAVASDTPKQPVIGYLRSDDGGIHWSEPAELSQMALSTLESSAGNELQIAATGDTLLAVWQVTGEIPGMGPLQAVYSLDAGRHWQNGGNPTGSEFDQSHPDLLADRQGRFHLVWLDDRDENGYQGLRYARTSSAGRVWELAQTVDESSCSCCWNRLSNGPDEQVNALYRDMEPRDMAMAQSDDAGENWRRVSAVGEFNWVFDGCPHNGGALAWSEATLHALVWTGEETKAGLYHLYSSDDGKTWSAPFPLGAETLAFHSDIAAQNNGHVLAIWDATTADGAVVMFSESLDDGRHWSTARQLSAAGRSAQFPRLVATSSGWLALWVEQKPGDNRQWMSAILK
ncbi:MAG: sialidase family protein [Gammaproteobacteria bacterium]